MVTKWIGFYGNKPNYTNKSTNHLFVEISPTQVVYLVKNTVNAQMEAIEIFQYSINNGDWSDIFFEIKEQSALIGLSFSNTSIYFNINEALLLPLNNLSASSAEDFLSLVYGPEESTIIKHDKIEYSLPFVTIYRIKNSLIDILNRNFILYNIQHAYSPILRDVFERDNLSPIFLKLVVYHQHIIVVYIKNNQLQLTQTYSFKSSDDILYYLLGIIQQDGQSAIQTQIEISGLIDQQIGLYEQLKLSFGIVSFDEINLDNTIKIGLEKYPAYTFTPFYKLMA
ncbi:MAG: DUF3822 family protein [Sediminibacterium sp.]|jgi:Protein of unknown function (DUF3822)